MTGITKCDMYYTMRRYYKMRQHRWPTDNLIHGSAVTGILFWNDKPHGNLIKITGMREVKQVKSGGRQLTLTELVALMRGGRSGRFHCIESEPLTSFIDN